MNKSYRKITIVIVLLFCLTAAVFVYLLKQGGLFEQKAHNISGQAVVQITAAGFSPSSIKVNKGTQVTFTNTDQALHRVASDPYPTHTGLAGFDSVEPLATEESYSYVFEEEGTFTFHDHLNPLKFKGTVIVE